MTIADRIQHLRKQRGISQEELADRLGVSRQAVSKWESEQSVPDLERVIAMSEFFETSTDYLLRGIEPAVKPEAEKPDATIFLIVATVFSVIGLLITCALWYEKQLATALLPGLIFMALGCLVFGIGATVSAAPTKARAIRRFWAFNIWPFAFFALSLLYNLFLTGQPAPYPMLVSPLIALPVFWLVYIGVCLGVTLAALKRRRAAE